MWETEQSHELSLFQVAPVVTAASFANLGGSGFSYAKMGVGVPFQKHCLLHRRKRKRTSYRYGEDG